MSEPDSPSLPRRLWSWAREILLTLALGALLLVGVGRLRAPDLPAAAPEFTLASLDGGSLSLASLRGQTVVLNFWATWCGPCRVELPTLVDFAAEHPEIPVYFVAVDGKPEDLRRFATDHGMAADHVLVSDDRTYAAYGVSTIPMTVIVKPDGTVGDVHAGILLRPMLWWMTLDGY